MAKELDNLMSKLNPAQRALLEAIANELTPMQKRMCQAAGIPEDRYRETLAAERKEQATGAAHLLATLAIK